MRKTFIAMLCLCALSACRELPSERERRIETELREQQESKNRWQAIAFVLGIGCTAVLFVGAAVGAKARKDAEQR